MYKIILTSKYNSLPFRGFKIIDSNLTGASWQTIKPISKYKANKLRNELIDKFYNDIEYITIERV